MKKKRQRDLKLRIVGTSEDVRLSSSKDPAEGYNMQSLTVNTEKEKKKRYKPHETHNVSNIPSCYFRLHRRHISI
jgi:hypothetical protein